MKELALHILDIAQNSLKAGAKTVAISIKDSISQNKLEITIADDGKGMAADFARQVAEPFVTTSCGKKTGLGLPLFKMAAELTGGSLSIESKLGQGTTVYATFNRSHLDTPPLGDIAATITTLVQGSPTVDFNCHYQTDAAQLVFTTAKLREAVPDLAFDHPQVLAWIQDHLQNAGF